MDKFHWLVLRALLWLICDRLKHTNNIYSGDLIKDLQNEIALAEKTGFEYYRP